MTAELDPPAYLVDRGGTRWREVEPLTAGQLADQLAEQARPPALVEHLADEQLRADLDAGGPPKDRRPEAAGDELENLDRGAAVEESKVAGAIGRGLTDAAESYRRQLLDLWPDVVRALPDD